MVDPQVEHDRWEPLTFAQQKERYLAHWKLRWDQGQPLNVEFLYGYIKQYIREPKEVIAEFPDLLSSYGSQDR